MLSYLNERKNIEIVKRETRHVKKREKGTRLKATIRRRSMHGNGKSLKLERVILSSVWYVWNLRKSLGVLSVLSVVLRIWLMPVFVLDVVLGLNLCRLS